MFEWTVTVKVDPKWVADGFNLTEERLNDLLQNALDFASSEEVQGTVITWPDSKRIERVQTHGPEGYLGEWFRDIDEFTDSLKAKVREWNPKAELVDDGGIWLEDEGRWASEDECWEFDRWEERKGRSASMASWRPRPRRNR
jgi:hypothetical protein